ncbi:SpoIIE family protein phosphatase [Kamptonema cortianum]|nr:SpoIIE family protein phosphatase [Kamptonema cortianum]MDL5044539.1 SpoIIE family protein phosphatase [Oscillatoria amoena NRMC-F 0135]
MSRTEQQQLAWERDAYRGLVEISSIINSEDDFDKLLQRVLEIAEKVVDAGIATLWLVDEATEDLVVKATSLPAEASAKLGELRVPKGKGVSGWSYANRQPVLVKDCQNDPRFYKEADKKTGIVTRSLLTVPLLSHGKCVGVLQALNPRQKEFFDEYELPVFEGYAKIVATAIENARLKEAELRNMRTAQELQTARDIQASFLPEKLHSGQFCEVAVLYQPAREIGGDFYDFFPVGEDVFCAVLGDVSGKGVPAALLMAQTLTQIRLLSRYCRNPQEVLESVNEAFCQQRTNGLFVTAICVFLDYRKQKMVVANAGHHDIVLADDGGAGMIRTNAGIPLGVMPGSLYPMTEADIRPGQALLLYSDGLPEARDGAGDEFGMDSIMGQLPAKAFCAKAMIDLIERELRAFIGKAPQHDDLTVFAIRMNESLGLGRRFEAPCEPAQFAAVREFIRRCATCAGYGDLEVNRIVLAIDEAVTNVYRHGYCGCDGNMIRLAVRQDHGDCVFEIMDDAQCVNPESIKSRDLEDVRPGGLGVHLISMVMDEVRLEQSPQGKGNRLVMRKKLPDPQVES